jgi:hypothetical protein
MGSDIIGVETDREQYVGILMSARQKRNKKTFGSRLMTTVVRASDLTGITPESI